MVFRRCSSLLKNEDEAMDAVQDVFVNLLRYKKNLHGQFMSSLLYTMATNICLNILRQRKRQGVMSDSRTLSLSMFNQGVDDKPVIEPGSFDPEFEKVENTMLMDVIFQDESETTRTICFLYHCDNMTLQEVADITGMSISGVRKKLLAFSARAKLKWGEGQL
jgi:RNA polymerase sigma-70 factor (ECF subfamily)